MINYLFAYFSWLLPPPLNKYCHKIKGVEFTNIKSVHIGLGTIIDNLFPNYVLIEEDVIISFGVRIITHIEVPDVNKEMYKFIPKKVIIKKNVFIGSSSIILPGVKIGENSIIGAGSVVTKSFPSNSLILGNPARLMKKL